MLLRPTNGATPLDLFLRVCPLLGPFVGRMLLRPTNGAAPLDLILRTCPLPGPFMGRMQYAPTGRDGAWSSFLLFFP